MSRIRIYMSIFVLMMITAACSGAAAPAETKPEEVAAESASSAAWMTLPLVNVATGETFTLAHFSGKTVYVEPMATWCTNCRRQQRKVIAARKELDPDEFIFLSLSVEDGLANQVLADYAQQYGFDWLFAVATPEMVQALIDHFGRAIITPPSTPHFIISPNGAVTELMTGFHEPADIVTLVKQAAQG